VLTLRTGRDGLRPHGRETETERPGLKRLRIGVNHPPGVCAEVGARCQEPPQRQFDFTFVEIPELFAGWCRERKANSRHVSEAAAPKTLSGSERDEGFGCAAIFFAVIIVLFTYLVFQLEARMPVRGSHGAGA